MSFDGLDNLAHGIGEAVKIVPELYADGIKPTVQAAGETVALIPSAINAALSPLRQWIEKREYNVKKTKKLLEKKLEKVPVDKIVTPEAYVAIPALQSISYCMDSEVLRDMYANLLATSMIKDKKWEAHPSFVEIIKQLSPDEAKLLDALNDDSYPLVDLNLVHSNRTYRVILRNFTDIADNICEHPHKIFSYLDNLIRLNLIEIPFNVFISDESIYKNLEEHSDINKIKSVMADQINKDDRWEFVRKKFQLTEYGRSFIEVCVKV